MRFPWQSGGPSCSEGPAPQQEGFLHGVGSFDPTPDRVLLWTRLTPPTGAKQDGPGQLELKATWEVSTKKDFSDIVASGETTTSGERDFTVTVDATGLQPRSRYYYRFRSGVHESPVGCTRTAAAGRLEEMVIGLVSCANFGFGYFNVYDLLSHVDNLDLVICSGDYIYEYGNRYYPEKWQRGRTGLRPKHACASLADFRTRYACYRGDPALQELHARVPWVCVWDDHEISDSAYAGGSDDIHPTNNKERRAFTRLKAEAIRAYLEWIPIRGLHHEHLERIDFEGCHRILHWGDLVTLVMTEGRISNRTAPVNVPSTAFYKEVAEKQIKDWDEDAILPAREKLLDAMRDPSRRLIGDRQVGSIATAVKESVEAGRPWQLILSQTIMSQIKAPKLMETVNLQPGFLRWISKQAFKVAVNEKIAGKEGAEIARMYIGMGRFNVPMNPDAWDGYQAEREKVLAALDVPGANPVVLAGDSHNAWAHELIDPHGKRLGVEFDGPSVGSPGFAEDIYSRFESKAGAVMRAVWPLWLFTPWVEDALKAANPDTLQYCNLQERGCVLLHLTRRRCHAEYHYVDTIKSRQYRHSCEAAFFVEAGDKGRLHRTSRYLTVSGHIPKRRLGKRRGFLKASHDVSLAMSNWWDKA